MSTTSLRTQIILPKDLRLQIERERKLSGESLAEYLRIAAKERLEREKRKKADLKKLAAEVVGAAKGTRTKAEVEEWIREIRRDREEEDRHWMSRWDEALKKNPR